MAPSLRSTEQNPLAADEFGGTCCRQRAAEQATALASFREMYEFGLDPFQIEAYHRAHQRIEAGGPAEKSGLEAGDIILEYNGNAIDSASDLPRMVGSTKPGSKATLTVWRKGAKHRFFGPPGQNTLWQVPLPP